MSVLGTSIAAGVAQVGLQSQSVARQTDRAGNQSRDIHRMRELVEAHMRGLDESEFESPAQLHIDGQLPEHQSPSQDARERGRRGPHPQPEDPTTPATQPQTNATAPIEGDAPLYRHLDVQA
ncbi:MAG: hypothetical protein K8S99_05220 [Planctomycetes bacterium]|nr:hypothetical protein [Planctomycetota bacterium]